MGFITYVPVIEVGEVPAGSMKRVDMEGRPIVVANLAGTYFAFQPDCPHAGTNLALGRLRDGEVECPNHRYRFDIATGKLTHPDGGCDDLATYDVEERDGMLCLKLEI